MLVKRSFARGLELWEIGTRFFHAYRSCRSYRYETAGQSDYELPLLLLLLTCAEQNRINEVQIKGGNNKRNREIKVMGKEKTESTKINRKKGN